MGPGGTITCAGVWPGTRMGISQISADPSTTSYVYGSSGSMRGRRALSRHPPRLHADQQVDRVSNAPVSRHTRENHPRPAVRHEQTFMWNQYDSTTLVSDSGIRLRKKT